MTYREAAAALNCYRKPPDRRDHFPTLTLDRLQALIGTADATVVHGDKVLLAYRFADRPGMIVAENRGGRGLLEQGHMRPARE